MCRLCSNGLYIKICFSEEFWFHHHHQTPCINFLKMFSFLLFIIIFYFTILYWFCHVSTALFIIARIENVFFNYVHSFLKMYLQKKMYLHHHWNCDLNALTWLLFEIQSLDPCTVVKLKMWLNTKSRLQNTVPGPFFL